MHELQQLHAELDVAQPAGPQLELAVGLAGGHVLLDPAAHRLDVLDEVLAAGGLPDERAQRVLVGPAQLDVPGRHPGLEQRLELPRLGPPLVVGPVARDGAHQRAVLALGPQRRVDRPQRALGGGRRAGAHEAGRQRRPDANRALLVGSSRRLGDEDDVDVADVVQLAAAGLAHADDGEPAASWPSPNSSRAIASAASSAASARSASASAATGRSRPGRDATGRGRRSAAARAGRRPAGRRMPCARLAARAATAAYPLAQALPPGAPLGVGDVRPVLGVDRQVVAQRAVTPRARRAAGSVGRRPARPRSGAPGRHRAQARAGPDGYPRQ